MDFSLLIREDSIICKRKYEAKSEIGMGSEFKCAFSTPSINCISAEFLKWHNDLASNKDKWYILVEYPSYPQ